MAGAMMYMFHPCMSGESNPGQLVAGAMMYMFHPCMSGESNPGQLVAGAMMYMFHPCMPGESKPWTTCGWCYDVYVSPMHAGGEQTMDNLWLVL